jgi:hypothetical protein
LQRAEESREPLFSWRAGFASRLPLEGSPLPSLRGEYFMRQKTFSLVVGLIFLLIAVMHVLRLALKWAVDLHVDLQVDRAF